MKKSDIEKMGNIIAAIIAVFISWVLFTISLSGYGSEGKAYSLIFLLIACVVASYFVSGSNNNNTKS